MDNSIIEKKIENLKTGQSLILVEPKGDGYFVGIGDKIGFQSWVITQKELNKLADLTDKLRDDL
jgi:hypothetical protein